MTRAEFIRACERARPEDYARLEVVPDKDFYYPHRPIVVLKGSSWGGGSHHQVTVCTCNTPYSCTHDSSYAQVMEAARRRAVEKAVKYAKWLRDWKVARRVFG